MDVSIFLKVVPGAFGVAGLLTFVWPGRARFTGEIFKGAVKKLRAAPNVHIDDYDRLTPERIVGLIDSDSRVRAALTEREIGVLRLLATMQFAQRSLALIVCAALIALSAWLLWRRHGPPQQEQEAAITHALHAGLEGAYFEAA
jgi:hypothetical protein